MNAFEPYKDPCLQIFNGFEPKKQPHRANILKVPFTLEVGSYQIQLKLVTMVSFLCNLSMQIYSIVSFSPSNHFLVLSSNPMRFHTSTYMVVWLGCIMCVWRGLGHLAYLVTMTWTIHLVGPMLGCSLKHLSFDQVKLLEQWSISECWLLGWHTKTKKCLTHELPD